MNRNPVFVIRDKWMTYDKFISSKVLLEKY